MGAKLYSYFLIAFFMLMGGDVLGSALDLPEYTVESVKDNAYFTKIGLEAYPPVPVEDVAQNSNDEVFEIVTGGYVLVKRHESGFVVSGQAVKFTGDKVVPRSKNIRLETDGVNDCKLVILYNPSTQETLFYHMPIMDINSGNYKNVISQDWKGKNSECYVVTSTADSLDVFLGILKSEYGLEGCRLNYGKVANIYSQELNKTTIIYGDGVTLRDDQTAIEDSTGTQLLGAGKSVRFDVQSKRYP